MGPGRRILLGAGYSVGGMIEHETTGRLATVRLIPQQHPINGEVVVDVLFASSGIEPEIVASAERLDILPGLTMPVARTGHLIALKLLARAEDRPQDDADLRALLAVASDADLDLARTSCAQIVARGFNRDRDLLAALREILDR